MGVSTRSSTMSIHQTWHSNLPDAVAFTVSRCVMCIGVVVILEHIRDILLCLDRHEVEVMSHALLVSIDLDLGSARTQAKVASPGRCIALVDRHDFA